MQLNNVSKYWPLFSSANIISGRDGTEEGQHKVGTGKQDKLMLAQMKDPHRTRERERRRMQNSKKNDQGEADTCEQNRKNRTQLISKSWLYQL